MTRTGLLLLEEATKLVHHTGTTLLRVRGTILAATVAAILLLLLLMLLLPLVLLHGVLRNGTHDRSTNCTEEPVISLVASEATGRTTGKSTHEATFTLLSTAGSLFTRTVRREVSRLDH